jgi:hypothetical protein
MMVFPSSYVTKHGTAATMQIANISACRRIEHPDHSTRERKKTPLCQNRFGRGVVIRPYVWGT